MGLPPDYLLFRVLKSPFFLRPAFCRMGPVKQEGLEIGPNFTHRENTPKKISAGPSSISPAPRERQWEQLFWEQLFWEQLFCCSHPDLSKRQ
jgi:hypothetical protein